MVFLQCILIFPKHFLLKISTWSYTTISDAPHVPVCTNLDKSLFSNEKKIPKHPMYNHYLNELIKIVSGI